MVLGAYGRIYANEKVQELKEELYNKFLEDLKSNKKEIETLLYILDEEQKWDFEDSESEPFKYKVNESFLSRKFYFIGSHKKAILRSLRIYGNRVYYTELEDEKRKRKINAYEKEIDGVKCIFVKVNISNKDRKKLLSGKYKIDMRHYFIDEANTTEVFAIDYLFIRYRMEVNGILI